MEHWSDFGILEKRTNSVEIKDSPSCLSWPRTIGHPLLTLPAVRNGARATTGLILASVSQPTGRRENQVSKKKNVTKNPKVYQLPQGGKKIRIFRGGGVMNCFQGQF